MRIVPATGPGADSPPRAAAPRVRTAAANQILDSLMTGFLAVIPTVRRGGTVRPGTTNRPASSRAPRHIAPNGGPNFLRARGIVTSRLPARDSGKVGRAGKMGRAAENEARPRGAFPRAVVRSRGYHRIVTDGPTV